MKTLLQFVTLLSLAVLQVHCGYDACPETKPDMLNVHLVCHTHDDVGWLKTVDEYYYGDRNDIQNAAVQHILNSVVPELEKNPERRFIYVEVAFFTRWWEQQEDEMKTRVKTLVEEGRLEFILGGWAMSDEAAAHYVDTIDQMTLGLKFLNDTFGESGRPRVAWQIDPFGHSSEIASQFAQMGFDGLFFGRLDYEDKKKRMDTQTMEIIWRGSKNLGEEGDIFTGVLYNGYNMPGGFCFDIHCRDEPIRDNKKLHGYNVPKRVDEFIKAAEDWARPYRTNHILMTMGTDFQYQAAGNWYTNLDKLKKYVNERQAEGLKMNVIYSTPSCYVKAVHEAGLTWETKEDDFFPYANEPHSYWTGYFSSRASQKRNIYESSSFLQSCKQLSALAHLGSEDESKVQILKEAMGINQHHDAVTGTEKQHVADDYAIYLSEGTEACETVITNSLNSLLKLEGSDATTQTLYCPLLNISQCGATESSHPEIVTIYNPISQSVTPNIRLPVTIEEYSVTGPDGSEIPSQVIPIPEPVINIPGREQFATHELVFQASNIPALGIQSYEISPTAGRNPSQKSRIVHHSKIHPRNLISRQAREDVVIGNEILQVKFDGSTGLVASVTRGGTTTNVKQNFFWYEGFRGDNGDNGNQRSSGAYAFRPVNSIPEVEAEVAEITVYNGDIVQEVHQKFNDYVSQVVRVYKGHDDVEFDWLVGPIPTDDEVGKEIITRYSTDLVTDGTFYTDSNGREMQKRVRDFRPTWDLTVTEPAAGNYYPVTSRILIKDVNNGNEVVVLNDRSQGGSSLNDGEIELMLHRRLLNDDSYGVGEALKEDAYGTGLVVRGRHWLLIGSSDDVPSLAARHRHLATEIHTHPLLSFNDPGALKMADWNKQYKTQVSLLKQELPQNIHVLTLEQWTENSVLLRLEHIMEIEEDRALSEPVTLVIEDFLPFDVKSIEEVTLGANNWKASSSRLKWNVQPSKTRELKRTPQTKASEITLQPMQIRSFIVTVS